MIGVLLMSHGKMAKGLLDSCKLFFCNELDCIEAICLEDGDDPEKFDERIKDAVGRLDDGGGVVAFCDLLGGTPSNRSMFCLNDRLHVIAGMNFPMVLEVLGTRLSVSDISEIDFDKLVGIGKDGVVDLNEKVKSIKAK